jgi:hypothetical protein
MEITKENVHQIVQFTKSPKNIKFLEEIRGKKVTLMNLEERMNLIFEDKYEACFEERLDKTDDSVRGYKLYTIPEMVLNHCVAHSIDLKKISLFELSYPCQLTRKLSLTVYTARCH